MEILRPQPEALVEAARARVRSPLAGRDRIASFALAGAFLAAAAAFATLWDSHRSPSVLTVCVFVALYAAASRVEFEVGAGTVVPTQLVLVPMLFVLPLDRVPLYVAVALLVGHVPDMLAGRLHPTRVAVLVASARHSLGAALVLTAVGERGPRLEDWPIYLGALGAQFAVDTFGFTLREWAVLGVSPRAELPTMTAVFGVDAGLASLGLLIAIATVDQPARVLLVAPSLLLLAVFARQRRTSIDRALELGSAYRGTAFLLADLIEAKDSYTGAHSREVVGLVLEVGDELGLPAGQRRAAELAAMLHDVGTLWIPEDVISKPGPLSAEERELIDDHTLQAERVLRQVGGLLAEVGSIVRSCHEHWDGRGYPDGLAGEQIPLIARIVSCCDAYSAMTTDRSYRRALSEEVAIEELRAHAGTQFDPDVADALIRVLKRARRPVAV
jgi:HD-GYP domain-containing protein (c-di-GMP phosphodiesterase class II)